MSKKIGFDVPRKHIGKKTTTEQESEIMKIQDRMQKDREAKKLPGSVPYALAKHEYFESSMSQHNEYVKTHDKGSSPETSNSRIEAPADVPEKRMTISKREKAPLSINETKLGVTLIISKDDCKKLGFDLNMPSRDALHKLRKMLKID